MAFGDLVAFRSFVELTAARTATVVKLPGLGGAVGVSHDPGLACWLPGIRAAEELRRHP